ncbi:hypothetical protein CAEBREN_14589 [Caenorhabditis brenneri]|uniref:Integrase catalytic domain-containing protein n=1 Tax=Caenorhabditis brenneri TaxID=135651 RepID=G0PDJ4_CAEBE|nr:hypothetical protein CAEBREN_14589 [Caenorhabditis brenneri]
MDNLNPVRQVSNRQPSQGENLTSLNYTQPINQASNNATSSSLYEGKPEQIIAAKHLLKNFSGEASEYPLFINTFDQFVHRNPSFSPDVKLGILANLLQGKAAIQLQPSGMTEEDYIIVRNNLDRQYNGNKYQQDILLNELDDMEFVEKDIDKIEETLNKYTNVAYRLKGLSLDIDQPTFTKLFVEKLPAVLRNKVCKKYQKAGVTFELLSQAAFQAIAEKKTELRFTKRSEQRRRGIVEINSLETVEPATRQAPFRRPVQRRDEINRITDKDVRLPFIQLQTPSGDKLIALVDSGASSSVISTNAAERLKLKLVGTRQLKFTGFAGDSMDRSCDYYRLDIKDIDGKAWATCVPSFSKMNTSFTATKHSDEDVQYLEKYKIPLDQTSKLTEIDGTNIDLILGNNVLNIMKRLERAISYELPSGITIERTLFGFVTYPKADELALVPADQSKDLTLYSNQVAINTLNVEESEEVGRVRVQHPITNANLQLLLEQLTSLEILGIENPTVQKKKDILNQELIKKFKESAIIDKDNKIYVQFPLNGRQDQLSSNEAIARRRLSLLCENKLKDMKIRAEVHKIVEEQLQSGIIEVVTPEMEGQGPSSFMPNDVVYKGDSNFTKIRIVNDASAHGKGELSINECIFPGPALINPIIGQHLRARLGKYLMVADIEKAFHQVRIQDEFRNLTKFLWLKDPKKGPVWNNVVVYRFTRLPFGISCSPFLLAVTILLYLDIFPHKINEKIKENLYVDNIMFITNSEDELAELYKDSKQAFANMHMNAREYLVNHGAVMEEIDESDRAPKLENKFLGLVWDSVTDKLTIKIATPPVGIPTRREIVAFLARNYDPTGQIAPLLVPLKKLISIVCARGLKWKERLPKDLIPKWDEIKSMFTDTVYELPRQVVTNYEFETTEIVLFSDASKDHYAAVAYLRVGYGNEVYDTGLLLSKSRVKPSKAGKEFTIPRMELISMELATNAAVVLAEELHMKIDQVNFFSDSTCTLYWVISKVVNNTASKWVANRVKTIHKNLEILQTQHNVNSSVRYVPTGINPADIASRGCSLNELKNSVIWNEGPPFLKSPETSWPDKLDGTPADPTAFRELCKAKGIELKKAESDAAEEIPIYTIETSEADKSIVPYDRTNSLGKLVSIMTKVCRFINTCAASRNSRHSESKKISFKGTIMSQFDKATEEKDLVEKRKIARKMIIADHYVDGTKRMGLVIPLKCRPVIEDQGLWRFQSRLGRASNPRITDDMRQPIVILQRHPLAKLIVMEYHESLNHQGVQDLIAKVQRKYWIQGLTSLVRQVRSKCVTCRKRHGKPFDYPYTRDLPPVRTSMEGPFTHIGIDYCGPFQYQILDKNNTKGKVWIMLLTCVITRAIHLEMIHDNSTKSFINAFKRFASRRGVPKSIMSDNAPSFKLGYSMINQDIKSLINNEDELACYMANQEIEIKLITPFSPWMGGIYERLVSLVKDMIYKILGKTTLPYLDLETLIIEVEGLLNSRPVTPNKKDVSDLPAICPMDFINPNVRLVIPEKSGTVFGVIKNGDTEQLTRQYLEKLGQYKEDLWREFTDSYFQVLKDYQPKKSAHSGLTPKVGQVVLVESKMEQRHHWPLGRIMSINKTTEGRVRSVMVKIGIHTVEKSVNQLIPLEEPGDELEMNATGNHKLTIPQPKLNTYPTVVNRTAPKKRGRPLGSKNKPKSAINGDKITKSKGQLVKEVTPRHRDELVQRTRAFLPRSAKQGSRAAPLLDRGRRQDAINGEASQENRRRNEAMRQDARIKFLILRYLKGCRDHNITAVVSGIKKMLKSSKEKTADHLLALVEFHREDGCEWTINLFFFCDTTITQGQSTVIFILMFGMMLVGTVLGSAYERYISIDPEEFDVKKVPRAVCQKVIQ